MITTFKIANIITHVAFIAVLIIVIFFVYGLKIEKDVVRREINYLLHKTLDPISRLYPDIIQHKDAYAQQIVIPPDSPEAKKEVDDHNKALLVKTAKYILALVFVALIAVLVIAWKYSRAHEGKNLTYREFLVKLVKYNIVTLIFVAIVYIGFTYFIGNNYIYIDYNAINVAVINKLIEIRGPKENTTQDKIIEIGKSMLNPSQ